MSKKPNPFKDGKIKPGLLRVMLDKFTGGWSGHHVLNSIGISKDGMCATDTHKAIIIGKVSKEYQSTCREDVEFAYQKAKIYGEEIQLDELKPYPDKKGPNAGKPKPYPDIAKVVGNMRPVMAFRPQYLEEIGRAAKAYGSIRVTLCLQDIDGVVQTNKSAGFKFSTEDPNDQVCVILMPMTADLKHAELTISGGEYCIGPDSNRGTV